MPTAPGSIRLEQVRSKCAARSSTRKVIPRALRRGLEGFALFLVRHARVEFRAAAHPVAAVEAALTWGGGRLPPGLNSCITTSHTSRTSRSSSDGLDKSAGHLLFIVQSDHNRRLRAWMYMLARSLGQRGHHQRMVVHTTNLQMRRRLVCPWENGHDLFRSCVPREMVEQRSVLDTEAGWRTPQKLEKQQNMTSTRSYTKV